MSAQLPPIKFPAIVSPLTGLQAETLRAAVDRIIPADDAPSGWEAGVGDYFAHLLSREGRFLFPTRQGLDALDAEAQATEGLPFAALAPDLQDGLLGRVEAGEVRADWPLPAADFFRRLVSQDGGLLRRPRQRREQRGSGVEDDRLPGDGVRFAASQRRWLLSAGG